MTDAKNIMSTWFGNNPNNWKLLKLKYIASKIDEVFNGESNLKIAVENIEGYTGQLINLDDFNYESELSKFLRNDILFNKLRPYLGKVYIADSIGGAFGELLVLRVFNQEILPRFLFFIMINKKFIDLVDSSTTGAKMPRASWEDFIKHISIPIPSLTQQNKIVAYLDQEVAKIDALIKKKIRLVELLEEKKKATISQAVTKGLNPNVKLKPSGIDWLGDIPEHWEVVKLKYLTDGLKYGANEAAEEDNPDFPRYIRITDIDENGNLKPETFKSIPLEIANDYILEDGDILFARSGATVGKTFRYTSNYGKSAYAGYLIRMRPNLKIDSKYMYYFTLSNSYWSQIYIDSIQATIQNFSGDKYANMLVTIPSIDEQLKIAEFLDNHLIQFTFLRDKINNSIDLLTEKRTAIISAAINGEINL